MHARLGTADNATNRYAVYFVRGPESDCLCVPADTELDKCHPALLHHDGTFTRFAQSGMQSATLRLTVSANDKLSFKLHNSASATRRPSSSLGKGADARLHGELRRLAGQAVPGGLPALRDGMLLILVRIGSLPLTDVAACAADGQSSLMWRLGVTIPKPPAAATTSRGAAPAAADAEDDSTAPEVIQAVSPCFAVKTDESRDIVCCSVLPSLQPPPDATGVTHAQLLRRAVEGGKGTKKELAEQPAVVSLVLPGGGKDSAKKAPAFVLGGGVLPPPQAIPTGSQTGALHDTATGGALVFSIHGLIQGAYTPGMPGSAEARQCEAALWLWPWKEAVRNITEASPGWAGTAQMSVNPLPAAPVVPPTAMAWGAAAGASSHVSLPPPPSQLPPQMLPVQPMHRYPHGHGAPQWHPPPQSMPVSLSSNSPLTQFQWGVQGGSAPNLSSQGYAPIVRRHSESTFAPAPVAAPHAAPGGASASAADPIAPSAYKRQRSQESARTDDEFDAAKVLQCLQHSAVGTLATGARDPSTGSSGSFGTLLEHASHKRARV